MTSGDEHPGWHGDPCLEVEQDDAVASAIRGCSKLDLLDHVLHTAYRFRNPHWDTRGWWFEHPTFAWLLLGGR